MHLSSASATCARTGLVPLKFTVVESVVPHERIWRLGGLATEEDEAPVNKVSTIGVDFGEERVSSAWRRLRCPDYLNSFCASMSIGHAELCLEK